MAISNTFGRRVSAILQDPAYRRPSADIYRTKCSGTVAKIFTGINFHELARDTGYARQHLSRVIKGQGGYSDACARSIAAALGVTVGDLVTYLDSIRTK